ncbi:RyR domain-containing protein [Streptomyces sp. NPDC006995]|uniref:RyR domain-containing protein n=1 Tax=Streptomyces sp. NPDC006995 TaxID=3156907 RepID=UPI0033DAC6AC
MTTPEEIAQVCHEANRAWQQITGDPVPSPAWDEAPAWQRDSAIDGVRHALNGATPAQLHQSWCDAKRADGWRHGAVKDEQARTHPCLVPYGDLPDEQLRKDSLFAAVVSALR